MKSKIRLFFSVLYIAAFNKGIIDFIPALKPAESFIVVAIDIVITCLGISLLKSAPKRFLYLIAALIVSSSLNYFAEPSHSLSGHLNGLREFTGIFFIFIFFNDVFKNGYHLYLNDRFKRFVKIFLVVQIPFSLIQFIEAHFHAGDSVGGSYGVGGGSGILTFSLFLLIAYLVEDHGTLLSITDKLKYLLSKIFYFIPITINETKISFILIPVYFLSLLKKKDLRSSLIVIIIAGTLLITFSSLYSDQGKSYENPIEQIFSSDFLDSYLAGDVADDQDVPRFTKIAIASALLSTNSSVLMFGEEYGAFKGGTTVEVSNFTKKFGWLLIGSRPYIFVLMISGGLSLIIIMYYLFFGELFRIPYRQFKNYSKPLLILICCTFVILQIYNDALRNQAFCMIFIYLIFYSKYFAPKKSIQI